jgi:hypothetical protein
MELGERLSNEWEKGDTEVKKRLGNLLGQIREVAQVDPTDNANLRPEMLDEPALIAGIPLLLIAVDSKEMLKFYRGTVQTNRSGWSDPVINFNEEWLIQVDWTHGRRKPKRPLKLGESPQPSFSNISCVRNFKSGETVMSVSIGPWLLDAEVGPTCGYEYRLNVGDMPLVIKIWDEVAESGLDILYKKEDVDWSDFRTALSKNNIWALRALAEKCDAKVPAESRRELLAKGHVLDPLLPYVMLTHLAAEHPDIFKEDHLYWKEKAPGSAVVGKLFRAALEEGKKGFRGQ